MTTDLPIADVDLNWPTPGATLASRYKIEDVIGRGGSSVIYRAKDLGLGRDVAVKLLDPRGDSSQEIELRKRRFYVEARLMAQLHAPSTIAMLDYGRTDDGLFFLVFEFIDGPTLEEVVERGPLDQERVRGVLLQVLESLREAHALGFMHRDIKPSNIMLFKRLGQTDGVKVIDFGIAKAVGQGSDALTGAGRVVGTPRYLAPERLTGKDGGPYSDLFSLGLVAYFALVGRTPLAHINSHEVTRALATQQQSLPASLDVDPTLRAAIDSMLQIDHRRRPQTVDDAFAALGVSVEPIAADDHQQPQNLIAFPLDLDPIGGTPVDELTGTTAIQSMTLTTGSLSMYAAPESSSAAPVVHDSLPDEMLAVTHKQTKHKRQESPPRVGLYIAAGIAVGLIIIAIWALI